MRVTLPALVLAASAVALVGPSAATERVVIGWVENVVMQDVGMKLKARIDSGAGISSIDTEIERIVPDSDGHGEHVRFTLTDENGRRKSLERKIVEWANIKAKGGTGAIRRPVVTLDICLGGKRLEGRFNLADRSGFLYPVLVGRNILRTGEFLIDPKKTFLVSPGCS